MLTPIELQGKVFKTGFGYDKKDVEAFLKEVVDDYERLYKENLDLNDKISVLSEGVQYYKSIEKTLQKALVLAEKTAQDTEAMAQKKADSMIAEAESKAALTIQQAYAKADQITTDALHDAKSLQLDARKTLDSLKLQISNLVQQFEHYKIQYKQLLSAQTELLNNDSFQIDFASLNQQLIEQPEVSEEAATNVKPEQPTVAHTVEVEESFEEDSMNQHSNYVIRDIAPEESKVYPETAQTMTEVTPEPPVAEDMADSYDEAAESVKEPTYRPVMDDTFIPTIDLAGILEEAKKESQAEEQAQRQVEEPTVTPMKVQEDTSDYDADYSDELTEQDLLQQLFSAHPTKKKMNKKSSGSTDDFEFLDL